MAKLRLQIGSMSTSAHRSEAQTGPTRKSSVGSRTRRTSSERGQPSLFQGQTASLWELETWNRQRNLCSYTTQ